MSLSFTGWTPSVFRRSANALSGGPASGGTVQPNEPTNTAASLAAGNTSGAASGDSALHSRQFMNPLTGNREVTAASSVYGNANVPAYLSDAVNSLNMEQLQRRIQLTNFQNEILNRYDKGGPSQYEMANVLQSMAVQPGAHYSTNDIADPNLGLGYLHQSDAAASVNSAKAAAVNQQNQTQTQVQRLQAQRASQAALGQPTYTIDQQIMNLQHPNPTATAAAGSNGWVSQPTF